MFTALVSLKDTHYRGVERDCELYANTKISIWGKTDDAAENAWLEYIDLLAVEPIVFNSESLGIFLRILNLCEKNKEELEIILFTKDINEQCDQNAVFIGFDVAGEHYSSALTDTSYRNIPKQFTDCLNEYGLFDSINKATEFAEYANSLSAAYIEPEFPYAPVKVYILKK